MPPSPMDCRSSHEPSIATSSVSWRALRPPVRSWNRCRICAAICATLITRMRAAASSIASGMPSTSRTISRAASTSAIGQLEPGAQPRARGPRTAPFPLGRQRLDLLHLLDASRPSRSRLVTDESRFGRLSSHRPTVTAARSTTCSKLSRIRRHRPRPAIACPSCSIGSPRPSWTPSEPATADAMPFMLRASVRSQNQTPPGQSPRVRQP